MAEVPFSEIEPEELFFTTFQTFAGSIKRGLFLKTLGGGNLYKMGRRMTGNRVALIPVGQLQFFPDDHPVERLETPVS